SSTRKAPRIRAGNDRRQIAIEDLVVGSQHLQDWSPTTVDGAIVNERVVILGIELSTRCLLDLNLSRGRTSNRQHAVHRIQAIQRVGSEVVRIISGLR